MRVKTRESVAIQAKRSKSDFIVTHFRASGPGGQHRNKVSTAVRIKDKITGLVAEATDSKSQETNKKGAFVKLVLKIIAHYEELAGSGRPEICTDIVRTYHFPRQVVRDHRSSNKYPLKDFLDGKVELAKTVIAKE